jgi:hypothetical protein
MNRSWACATVGWGKSGMRPLLKKWMALAANSRQSDFVATKTENGAGVPIRFFLVASPPRFFSVDHQSPAV